MGQEALSNLQVPQTRCSSDKHEVIWKTVMTLKDSYNKKPTQDALGVLQKMNVGSSFPVNDCNYELWKRRETPIKITVFCEDGHPESKQQYQKPRR